MCSIRLSIVTRLLLDSFSFTDSPPTCGARPTLRSQVRPLSQAGTFSRSQQCSDDLFLSLPVRRAKGLITKGKKGETTSRLGGRSAGASADGLHLGCPQVPTTLQWSSAWAARTSGPPPRRIPHPRSRGTRSATCESEPPPHRSSNQRNVVVFIVSSLYFVILR